MEKKSGTKRYNPSWPIRRESLLAQMITCEQNAFHSIPPQKSMLPQQNCKRAFLKVFLQMSNPRIVVCKARRKIPLAGDNVLHSPFKRYMTYLSTVCCSDDTCPFWSGQAEFLLLLNSFLFNFGNLSMGRRGSLCLSLCPLWGLDVILLQRRQ